ncbi:MAG: uracil-DNA glycosylase [bacterium]
MTETPSPSEEIADVAKRLRTAVEIQALLRDEPLSAPSAALAPLRAPGPARSAGSSAVPSPAPKPAAPPRPAPAAHVEEAPSLSAVEPAAMVAAPWRGDPSRCNSLGELHDAYAECQRCGLGKTRTKFVFGVGNPHAKVVFVGEAPGRDEDLQGEPFVGAAGQLLNKILAAIDFKREDIYIANILKCRPPGNRNPEPIEIASCEPILRRQIEVIQPLILCTLGSFAAKTMLGATEGISRLRGRVHEYRGIPLIPTFHPAALLRNPAWKQPTWEDVQLLRREYDRLVAAQRD